MPSAVTPQQVFRFGLFEADVTRNTLTRSGVRVKIQDQPFRVLVMLLERPGEIVAREELRQKLWPEGTFVDFDGSLNVILKKLRAAIEDDFDNPRFVETVPRRGYRFIAPISTEQPEPIVEMAKTAEPRSAAPDVKAPQENRPWKMLVLAAFALLVAGLGWWYFLRFHSSVNAGQRVVAVLPLSNEGAGPDFDYLRYAIANDLVNDLTYAKSISVRPFASTSKYGAEPVDPAATGKELRVTHVLAGSFLRDQQSLRVNLELTDVAQKKIVWRDEVSIGPQELIGLHQKLAASATQQLLPAMNISGAVPEDIPSPKNEQAFDLFLHSAMVSLDPGPNQMAIQKLEQSVTLDRGYAPAWHQLAWRYYVDYHYGNGGEAALAKSLANYKRERELDPNGEPWVSLRVEQGDLQGAYDEVTGSLQKYPSANAHFSMSYVLRYAGLLDESRKECEAAFAIDPVHGYRSCAISFILAGDYAGAQKFINLDELSGVAALYRMVIALRMRNTSAALAEADAAAQLDYHNVDAKLIRVCLGHPPQSELVKAVAELEDDAVSSRDPEVLYQNADASAFCGQPDAAMRELGKAIKGNYCSYPAMEKDPLFDSIRQRPEFEPLRQAGIRCQQTFLAHRGH
jgi:DNA-binding winged helix-turn-helix (wHTH) protein/TolB-like protein